MVARVLFSSSMIRVSKPGVNVQTATIKDLLLDVNYRNSQILEHGIIPVSVSSGGSSGLGPWEGTKSIGPYGTAPDVSIAFVIASGKQLNPPRIDSPGLGSGQSGYSLTQMNVTGSQISVKVGAAVPYTQGTPPNLVGLSYVVFRKGVIG